MASVEQNLPDFEQTRGRVEKVLRDSALTDADLGVMARNNSVVLKGFVRSVGDREKAERLARDTAPGATVVNELVVRPNGSKDAVYEAGVESFPASDPPSWMSH